MQPHTRQYYALVILLGVMTAFTPLSIDMYLPALPSIAIDLAVDPSRVQLSLASFFIGMSLGQLFYGPLSDRYGRKKPLYIGMAVYILASAGCALAYNVEMLIAFRFLQALGSCAGAVISRAIVRDLFDHKQGAQVFSLQMLVMGVAPILAPLAGSYVLMFAGWRSIFWILTMLSVACLIYVARQLPETKKPDVTVRLSRAFHTYRDIARNREFLGYAFVSGLGMAGMFAYITACSFVFIDYYGLEASHFSWIFGSNALGLIAASQVNAWLLRRGSTPEKILTVALYGIATSGVLLIVAGLLHAPLFVLMIPLFFYIALMGVIFPNTTAGALQHERARAGAASALIGMMQFSISTVVSSVLSLLHAQSALPMAFVMGSCGITALTIYRAMKLGRTHITPLPASTPPVISD